MRTFDYTIQCPYCNANNEIEIDPDSDDNNGEVECDRCGQLFDVVNVYVEVNADAKPRPEGSRRPPPPPAPAFPPDGSPLWIEALGHRWVTNGAILLRDDGPLPANMDQGEWVRPDSNIIDHYRRLVADGVTPNNPRRPVAYAPAFAPVLSALEPMGRGRFGRDGEVIAVIAPYNPEAEGVVGEDGQPLKK